MLKIFFWKRNFFNSIWAIECRGLLFGDVKGLHFGPTFRAENSNTSRHLAEFWMVEPEIAFADLEDNATLAEALLKAIIKHVLENCSEDLNFFTEQIDKGLTKRLLGVVEKKFEKISYTDAIEILKKVKEILISR